MIRNSNLSLLSLRKSLLPSRSLIGDGGVSGRGCGFGGDVEPCVVSVAVEIETICCQGGSK